MDYYERAEELHRILWNTLAENIEKYISEGCEDIYEMKQSAFTDMVTAGLVNKEEQPPLHMCYACEVFNGHYKGRGCCNGACPIAMFNERGYFCENIDNPYRRLKEDWDQMSAEDRQDLAMEIADLVWLNKEDYEMSMEELLD